jgi:hypothetical protein
MKIQTLTVFILVLFFLSLLSCQSKKKAEKLNVVSVENIEPPQLTKIHPYPISNKVFIFSIEMGVSGLIDSVEYFLSQYHFPDSWEIAEKVFSRPNPFRNDSLENIAFSSELTQWVKESKQTEVVSRKAILQSKAPTDKPLLIEGEIFTSLFEEYNKYVPSDTAYCTMKEIKIPFAFENTHYKEKWTDTILLVHQNTSWYVHDVLYGRKSQYSSLQERLKAFIRAGQEEQRQLQKQKK